MCMCMTAHVSQEGPSNEALSKATVTAQLVRQADGEAVMEPVKVRGVAGV